MRIETARPHTAGLDEEVVMSRKDKSEKTIDNDWETRTLCSDGNCIGIIGNDGRCKECGKPLDPDSPEKSETETAQEWEAGAPPDEPSPVAHAPDDNASNTYWQSRRLCIDESCIGVIGTDGHCKECGKPAE